MKLKQFLMNEEGSSPGGGAVPPAPASTAATAGAPSAPPAIDTAAITAAVSAAFGEMRNGLFADLRKAGALGKEKPTETAPPPAQAQGAPASGLSMADVESMLERERVITRAATQHTLDDKQLKRMKSALSADKPDDVSAWTSSYLADMGLAKAPTTAAPAANAATTAPVAPNAPAAAPSAPSAHVLPTVNGMTDLFNLSNPQLQSLGPSGVRENLEKMWAIGNQMNGAPARPKPPSQR